MDLVVAAFFCHLYLIRCHPSILVDIDFHLTCVCCYFLFLLTFYTLTPHLVHVQCQWFRFWNDLSATDVWNEHEKANPIRKSFGKKSNQKQQKARGLCSGAKEHFDLPDVVCVRLCPSSIDIEIEMDGQYWKLLETAHQFPAVQHSNRHSNSLYNYSGCGPRGMWPDHYHLISYNLYTVPFSVLLLNNKVIYIILWKSHTSVCPRMYSKRFVSSKKDGTSARQVNGFVRAWFGDDTKFDCTVEQSARARIKNFEIALISSWFSVTVMIVFIVLAAIRTPLKLYIVHN